MCLGSGYVGSCAAPRLLARFRRGHARMSVATPQYASNDLSVSSASGFVAARTGMTWPSRRRKPRTLLGWLRDDLAMLLHVDIFGNDEVPRACSPCSIRSAPGGRSCARCCVCRVCPSVRDQIPSFAISTMPLKHDSLLVNATASATEDGDEHGHQYEHEQRRSWHRPEPVDHGRRLMAGARPCWPGPNPRRS